ncbi:tetratricopeptide repeat protein [Dactylosporangium vinaceum]|uniref:Tetratricopeptide repeat protein n=1 Tax=Dactylosporangium vinaceum TaxID=53362 RepID=A0ABV5MAU3_9ACTN|nr:tetratricopeptide repeat protein [Dactylosporangium vinaceum]UAB92903.1 tetratricopeptide repeat protein [Dactylosporangium vinaceum]
MTVELQDVVTLDRARAEARAGRLAEAGRLLDGVGAPSVAGLDLRARVYAQLGELDRADACWAEALRLDPGHTDARRGRAAIARLRSGRPGPLRLAVAATAFVVVVGGIASAGLVGSAPPAVLVQPSATQQPPSLSPSASPSASPPVVSAADRVAGLFVMDGVRVQRQGEDVRLVFTIGIFSADTRFAGGAAALLDAVGRRLPEARVTVTVVGHTVAVAGGRTSGGSTTAYARAQAAAVRLAAASGLPLTDFTLATADQAEGPWPDAPLNRTVTLVLHP